MKVELFVVVLMLQDAVVAQTCTCDLVSNGCDLNCCCDPLCTDSDKLSFSKCTPVNQNRIEKVCVSDSVLYSSNGKYQAEGTGGGLFCIFKDNYEARYFYSTVGSVSTTASFDTLAKRYRTSSYSTSSATTQNFQSSFKAGDPLFVLFSNNEQGYIAQPMTYSTGSCQDNNQARFLENKSTQCTRYVSTLSTLSTLSAMCTTEKTWSGLSYASGYRVAPFPSFILGTTRFVAGNGSTVTLVTINDARLVTPGITLPLKCQKDTGFISNCSFTSIPAPSYDAVKQACNNVVLQVEYEIGFVTANQTVQISSVNVSLVLGDVLQSASSFQQKFSTVFKEVIVGNTTNTTVLRRSGNPGYIVGLPVVSGNSFVDVASGSIFVAVNQNSASWLSTIMATSQTTCNDTSPRLPVAFGTDYRSGCFMVMENGMTLAECQQLQQSIYNLLLKDVPTHIASFGNSDGTSINNWVPVINIAPAAQPAVSNGQCGNMITGVTYEFLFAKSGYFSNPQNKIVGFQVKYASPKSLHFQCNGITCQSSSLRVEVTQAVSFVDVSSTPQTEVKPKPKFKSKAPTDFFFPFL